MREKHAAGINFESINSIYWWQLEIQREIEFKAFFKVRKENMNLLKGRILKPDTYETMCMAVSEAFANHVFEE